MRIKKRYTSIFNESFVDESDVVFENIGGQLKLKGDSDFIPNCNESKKIKLWFNNSDAKIYEKHNNISYSQLVEERHHMIKDINYLCETKAGGTVTWDLYYFEVNNFEKSTTNLEFGEIIYTCWKDVRQIKQMCIDGRIKEDRTVGVLLKYLIDKEQSID